MFEWLKALVGASKGKSKKAHGNSLQRCKPGARFGHLTLVRRIKTREGHHYTLWLVRCDCGTEQRIREHYLFRKPNPKTHCGCKIKTTASTNKDVYGIWKMVNRRCYFPSHVAYDEYGGRGISVHPAWRDLASQGLKAVDKNDKRDLEAFTRFFEYVGPRPTPEHTLDRKDPDGNYEPGNVRWATPEVQAMNKRNVHAAMARMRAWERIRKAKQDPSTES